jgi:glycosyltransferase involved in cell wall biosynthesis
MGIPLVIYVTWNRLGITSQNLKALFKTEDDFDLYIIDNGSIDGTRDYLKSLKDNRIKEIKLLDENYGLIYAANYGISKRKKGQPLVNIDQDVHITSKNWVKNLESVVKEFPEVGLIGNVRSGYFEERNAKYEEIIRNGVKLWKSNFILGCMMYHPAHVMDKLGYWSEELHLADLEINSRIDALGLWKGFCPDNVITIPKLSCSQCDHNNSCKDPNNIDSKKIPFCLRHYKNNYGHREFYQQNCSKFKIFKKNLTQENVFCASTHDLESMKKCDYDEISSRKNFDFYKKRT